MPSRKSATKATPTCRLSAPLGSLDNRMAECGVGTQGWQSGEWGAVSASIRRDRALELLRAKLPKLPLPRSPRHLETRASLHQGQELEMATKTMARLCPGTRGAARGPSGPLALLHPSPHSTSLSLQCPYQRQAERQPSVLWSCDSAWVRRPSMGHCPH